MYKGNKTILQKLKEMRGEERKGKENKKQQPKKYF